MAQAHALKATEIVTKVMNDDAYAKEIQEKAQKAIEGGSSSQDWKDYFDLFAKSPGELVGLGTRNAAAAKCDKTIITLSTVTTPVCFTCGLTTTTTTSN